MALREVPVVHVVALYPGELVDGLLEASVSNGVLLQERVAGRIEEAAVERGDLERRAAAVDDAEERREPRPEGAGGRQEGLPVLQIVRHGALDRLQSVLVPIPAALCDR